ncbi:MAG: hypothetical protein ABSC56_11485 [Solirubrobacteraceae bacterium]|jgi:hypothetical protein
MTDNTIETGDLSPDEVGARVAAILSSAERDARAVIEAARRGPGSAASEIRSQPLASDDGAHGLSDLTQTLESLVSRVSAIERTIDERLDSLSRALARAADAGVDAAKPPAADHWAARHERLRAVDLALRGFSRAQIAAELRSMLGEAEIERLLDDVLEQA